jgi:transcription elongation factor Elf1
MLLKKLKLFNYLEIKNLKCKKCGHEQCSSCREEYLPVKDQGMIVTELAKWICCKCGTDTMYNGPWKK